MVSKIILAIILSIFLNSCISITTTINTPPTTKSTSYIEKKESRATSPCTTPSRIAPKKRREVLSFRDFFNYIGLLEHSNNPRLIVHKNIDEKTFTVYGVYPYTKLRCYKAIETILKTKNSIYKKSLAIATNHKIMNCIERYYREIYNRLKLNTLDKQIAKLYGAFYIHTDNLKLAKSYLRLSSSKPKEFMRLTILYYVRLNRRYLIGWINRVFK